MNKEKKTATGKQGGGILSGLLLLVIGIGVLWYNEGRTVKTQGAINEARRNYTDIEVDEIDSKYDGKLVATKGKLDITEASRLVDEKFGISASAAKMKRVVEMYQWKEKCETDEDDNKNCTYEKVWDEQLIDSSEFNKAGYTNPVAMPYDSEVYIASNVRLGAFVLPDELINSLSYDKKVSEDVIASSYKNNVDGIVAKGAYLTNVKDDNPEVGNVRISYSYLDSVNVSVMAVQNGNSFEAFTSKNGKDVYKIMKGSYTGAQILEKMTKSNNTLKWVLRIVGIIVIISAFGSMFSFINNIASKIPILGSVVTGATGLISAVLGICVSFIVIALAWFRFRPLLSIILIVIVIALVLCLKMKVFDKVMKKK